MTADRTSIVVGTVGTVTDFYELCAERLAAGASTWDDLAKRIGSSRQYVTRVIREPKMPLDLVVSICRTLGISIESVIQPTAMVRSLVISVPRGPGGSSGGGKPSGDLDLELLQAENRDIDSALTEARERLRDRDIRVAELERQLTTALDELGVHRGHRQAQSPQSQHFTF